MFVIVVAGLLRIITGRETAFWQYEPPILFIRYSSITNILSPQYQIKSPSSRCTLSLRIWFKVLQSIMRGHASYKLKIFIFWFLIQTSEDEKGRNLYCRGGNIPDIQTMVHVQSCSRFSTTTHSQCVYHQRSYYIAEISVAKKSLDI